jgi:hypothetical protein
MGIGDLIKNTAITAVIDPGQLINGIGSKYAMNKYKKPSEIVSDNSKAININNPIGKLLNGAVNGASNGGLFGGVKGAVDTGKDMIGDTSKIKDALSTTKSITSDYISPQRLNYSIMPLGRYLRCSAHDYSQEYNFGIKDKWNKLSTGSKVAIGTMAGIGGLYALDKIGDTIKDKFHLGDKGGSGGGKLKTKVGTFQDEFYKDNPNAKDLYKVNESNYYDADGNFDSVSYQRDSAFANKQLGNAQDIWKDNLKLTDGTRFKNIQDNEAFLKSYETGNKLNSIKKSFVNIPKPLLYGGAAVGTYAVAKKLTDNRR